ncbi:hypothetical protein GA0115240_102016, partial [Streptomyces sp. DvalAA-14]
MSLRKGENTGLPTAAVRLQFGRRAEAGPARAHACVLLVSAGPGGGDGAVRDAGDLVHPGAPVHPGGAIRYEGSDVVDGYAVDTVAVDLASLADAVTSVVLVARGDGTPFGRIPGVVGGRPVARASGSPTSTAR